jgi:hypothetical protein
LVLDSLVNRGYSSVEKFSKDCELAHILTQSILLGTHMTVSRTAIEKALDELISNEEGMRFQGLAVVLAKQKWPDLIASERKKDLGLDAHAPALLARDGKGKGLACSLTATLEKIKADVEKIHRECKGPRIRHTTIGHQIHYDQMG